MTLSAHRETANGWFRGNARKRQGVPTPEIARAIRERHADGETVHALMRAFDLDRGCIRRILDRQTFRDA
ncbi:MAG: hypothetical protein KGL39_35480 [Patescibacteria group bacterium]|nr:hypothetical protein [Patescibacteria group bacterium]